MDDNMKKEDKICPNCKREIPADNFTIHSVHCARNIRLCPVCKEPVPQAELQDHHEKLHKMLPCKKCGESVCGTDLEDHIRDSCAHTIKTCRYCELELPRRDLPAHEAYCGVRTEQCPDCHEWVMIKYRQLHLDSNHGFVRLDDDPEPPSSVSKPIKDKPRPSVPFCQRKLVTANEWPKVNNKEASTSRINQTSYLGNMRPGSSGVSRPSTSVNIQESSSTSATRPSNVASSSGNRQIALPKRTNDQPQINTAVEAVDKIKKELPSSRDSTKKRPAPQPPGPASSNPIRDLPYYRALARQQHEEKQRQEQTAYNLSVGLPPVHSAAAKVDKLRKMDALQNRETEDLDYRNRLQGHVWTSADNYMPIGNTLGMTPNTTQEHQIRERNFNIPENSQENLRNAPGTHLIGQNSGQEDMKMRNRHTNQETIQPVNSLNNPTTSLAEWTINDFSKLKPMTPKQFMDRFNELQDNDELGLSRGWGRGRGRTRTSLGVDRGDGLTSPGFDRGDGRTSPRFDRKEQRTSPESNSEDEWPSAGFGRGDGRTPSSFGRRDQWPSSGFGRGDGRTPSSFGKRDQWPSSGFGRGDGRTDRVVHDRFSEIKSSLRELRRDLNEVTAPYNFNSNENATRSSSRSPARHDSASEQTAAAHAQASDDMEVRLPCEFCAEPVPAQDLVQHQTGCRPDLAQYRPPSTSSSSSSTPSLLADDQPLIPCEFCMEALPLYLICEHQDRCRRENNLLYPD